MDEQVKQLLLRLLDKFVEVCESQHLQYFLAGGSVLGAVRHKGFIPWDDDIDVHMPRADYEKIQQLPDSVWGDGFRLATWHKTQNYPFDFPKLELTNTTVIERLHPDYVGGVFLDIFPLDGISDNPTAVARFEEHLKKIENRYIECTIKNDNECHSIWELVGLKTRRCFYNHISVMQQWEKLAMSFGYTQDKVCHSHGYAYYHGGMPIQWFGEGVYLEFEGKKYLVPTEYDIYLKHLFGDYMQLPPIENRRGHEFMFVDYNRRVSETEKKSILQNLHKKYAYSFSLKYELKYILRKLRLK